MGFQLMAQTVIWTYVFVLCLSASLWFFGNELEASGIAAKSLPLEELRDHYNATALAYEGGGGFNPAFIFGDFGKSITEFMDIVSGKYLFNMMMLFGLSENFVIGAQVITGFLVVGTCVYLVSGRA